MLVHVHNNKGNKKTLRFRVLDIQPLSELGENQ
jgi:hypothetical protein